jgi:DNA-binding beta-propeller fold protein YncE
MSILRPTVWIAALLGIALIASTEPAVAQNSSNPYAMVDGWAKLPGGREMGAVGKTTVDPDGRHIWAVIRCDAGAERFGSECADSDLDPVLKFDPDGNVVESFGSGMFIWPHGIDVDSDGNVWVTDAVSSENIPEGDERGHQVIKFSPRGQVLMTLGTAGEEGSGPNHFTSPSDVAVAENGDVFIADGHNDVGNNRVAKYNPRGEFVMSWGETGYGPSEFRALHAIAIDASGRVFVGDRSNSRIQIFDPQGNHIATWTQFGRPSGIAFDDNGQIYVADSESDDVQNPGWEMGIRIGEVETGWVTEFIRFPWADPRVTSGNGAEFVAVDLEGNMYGGEPRPRMLRKYVRVRP